MNDENTPKEPSEEEIKNANEQALAFLEQLKAVPQDQRTVLNSEKFSGPIATHVIFDQPNDDSTSKTSK